MSNQNYHWAELQIRQGKTVSRAGWPAGKTCFLDMDGDGRPDTADPTNPAFIPMHLMEYERRFQESIKLAMDGEVIEGWVTQTDYIASDWMLVE